MYAEIKITKPDKTKKTDLFMNLINRYTDATKNQKKLFWKALYWLLIARINTGFMPSRKYLVKLGQEKIETPEKALPEYENDLIDLKKSIRRAVKYTPFKTKCLQQAYAAKAILDRKNIPSTVYFGVAKNNDSGLIAHAWLRCGNIYITGEKERSQFIVVQYFS